MLPNTQQPKASSRMILELVFFCEREEWASDPFYAPADGTGADVRRVLQEHTETNCPYCGNTACDGNEPLLIRVYR